MMLVRNWLWAVCLGFVAPQAMAEVLVGGRHLVILKPGLDAIWGNYIFAVQNESDQPQQASIPVMLPKEVVDYRPHEGVTPEDLRLRDDGIAIEKVFPPGQQIISLGFLVNVSLGSTLLTFEPPGEVPDFTLLTPSTGELTVSDGPFEAIDETPDPAYRAFRGTATFAKGNTISVRIGGVPEGRLRFWIIGASVGGLMLLAAIFFALRSRPKLTEHANESMILAEN